MLTTLVLVFIAVVITAIGVVVNVLRDSGGQAAPSPEPTAEPASEEESAEERPSPEEEELLNPGWQRASVPKWGFVYEVPGADEDWIFEGAETLYGVNPDDEGIPELAMSGISSYGVSPCDPSNSLAVAGAQGISETDDTEEMAEGVARKWAELGYETESSVPEVSLRSVEEFSANGLEGHYGIVEATPQGSEDECFSEGGVVHTVVVPYRDEEDQVRAFSVIADTGYDDSLGEDTIETILNSLRDSQETGG
ncbi:hypothetical protein [Allosalinactinospora lopnorensis]|uniref:hypothetical protein n=1 Tax=Allosalinactinospora lopnorensis TaxID=1352348 RepID=UPI000623D5B3|nr:hypothetical protein [Allosalinactinospora lopnorensis]